MSCYLYIKKEKYTLKRLEIYKHLSVTRILTCIKASLHTLFHFTLNSLCWKCTSHYSQVEIFLNLHYYYVDKIHKAKGCIYTQGYAYIKNSHSACGLCHSKTIGRTMTIKGVQRLQWLSSNSFVHRQRNAGITAL